MALKLARIFPIERAERLAALRIVANAPETFRQLFNIEGSGDYAVDHRQDFRCGIEPLLPIMAVDQGCVDTVLNVEVAKRRADNLKVKRRPCLKLRFAKRRVGSAADLDRAIDRDRADEIDLAFHAATENLRSISICSAEASLIGPSL